MSKDRPQGRQIIDVRSEGKWIEIWFQDGGFDASRYDDTCKSYMLTDAIDAAGLSSHVWKNGLLGIWLNWRDDRPVSAALNLTDLKCCENRVRFIRSQGKSAAS